MASKDTPRPTPGGFTPGKQSGGRWGRGKGGDNRGQTGRPTGLPPKTGGNDRRPAPVSPFNKVPQQPNQERPAPLSPFKKNPDFTPGKQSGGRWGRGRGGANRGQTGRPDIVTPRRPEDTRLNAMTKRLREGNF